MRLLTHADDCGLTRGITRAILDCARSGALLGASVMAGGDCADEAARSLEQTIAGRHGLPVVGVHINLLEGRCLLPPERLPLLARPDGFFRHSLGSLYLALSVPFSRAKQALLDEIAEECAAQTARIQAAVPTARLYLDGHLHVHILPALRPVLFSLLERFPIDYVRVQVEPRYAMPSPPRLRIVGTIRRELLRLWSRGLPAALSRRGVRAPDCFIGAFCSGSMTLPRLIAGLDHARRAFADDALVEVMFHPGGFEPDDASRDLAYREFYLASERNDEYALLQSSEFHHLMLHHDKDWQGAP